MAVTKPGGSTEAKQDTIIATISSSAVPVGAGTAAAAGRVTMASDSPDVAALGAISGAKVITDANGTIQQYLRGLVYLLITSGQALVTASLAAGSALIGKVGIDQTTPGTTNLVAAGQTGTWTVQPGNTANTTAWKVDGSAVTQPISVATIPSHAVTNAGTFAVQAAEADGANVTLGAKADAKSTATDATSITAMSVLKQISASVQAPPSQAVTNAGTFAVQASNTPLTNIGAGEYETVAASQTAQALGATGATGDYLSGVLVIPASTSPGNVLLLDNATSMTIFAGGASSVSNLVPFFIPLGMISVSGAWKLTTGANVSCIGIGNFT